MWLSDMDRFFQIYSQSENICTSPSKRFPALPSCLLLLCPRKEQNLFPASLIRMQMTPLNQWLTRGKREYIPRPCPSGTWGSLYGHVVSRVPRLRFRASVYQGIKWKRYLSCPPGAFLYSSNRLCGFTEIHTDSLYMQTIQKMYCKYVVSVCIDETSDCFTLNISPVNALFETAEETVKPQVQQVVWTVFDTKSEIVAIGTNGPHGS